MHLFVGTNNDLNKTLINEISKVIPVRFIECGDFLASSSQEIIDDPQVIFVNLMDVGLQEEAVRNMAQTGYPQAKLFAIHCFQLKSMIDDTLAQGYDAYFSVFNFSEELPVLLREMELISTD